ncbi:Gpi16 subunit GPI transamidase component [Lentinula aciculospora]|uniref:Gpi16 subunit GPI transamidase component n=1 Tax=Lentinula aciculospora TaxID=153920 RepID=A0A9W9AQD1_9AGAR|nr:Gpi16 subunit GPI transamidase component [Lentinula aciculospora]
MLRTSLFLILLLLSSVFCLEDIKEEFKESLSIKSLRDGRVASSFSFKTLLRDAIPRDPQTLAFDDDDSQHYTLFPLTLGQILRQYAITELHLTLNAGKWDYDSWGYPDETGVGVGAELRAWMAGGSISSIDDRWQGVRNALAGLFCASLGSLNEQRTTSPRLSFPPEGALPDWGLPHELRHASHASEHVCTENLTPFLKLLPCKSLSGLAMLLNPHRIFDADWHGIGLHVLWRPEGVEVRLNVQLVSDPLRISGQKKQDWSFHSLFDRRVEKACPVAKFSRVSVDLPSSGLYRVYPEPMEVIEGKAYYDLKNNHEVWDIGTMWPADFEYPLSKLNPTLVPFSVRRNLLGSTQDRGQLSIVVTNNQQDTLQLLYLETMPWIIQFYLHTIRVHSDDVPRDDLISNMSYVLPVPHARPATFESVLTLPGRSSLTFTMDVAKAFLRYTEHPPDAQRGWDLLPAIFTPLTEFPNGSINLGRRVYTPSLLVDLATPDFSMPYNVIIFTCSVVAFIFGSVFNALTRKFIIVRLEPQKQTENSVGKNIDANKSNKPDASESEAH